MRFSSLVLSTLLPLLASCTADETDSAMAAADSGLPSDGGPSSDRDAAADGDAATEGNTSADGGATSGDADFGADAGQPGPDGAACLPVPIDPTTPMSVCDSCVASACCEENNEVAADTSYLNCFAACALSGPDCVSGCDAMYPALKPLFDAWLACSQQAYASPQSCQAECT